MLKYILMMVMLIWSCAAHAASDLPMDDFAKLPILHEGRIKPIDSFARIEILKFSKKEKLENENAVSWLVRALFDPAEAAHDKIFLIDDTEARHLLGLEERKKPLYSYAELVPGLEKTSRQVEEILRQQDRQKDTSSEKLLSVHENALEYTHILRSFSSVLPLNIDLSPEWRSKADISASEQITFKDLQKIGTEIEERVRKIIRKKGQNPATYTKAEQDLVTIGWQLKTISDAGQRNRLLRVIPINDDAKYASPWELINEGKGSPATEDIMQKWIALSAAWQTKDVQAWNAALEDLKAEHSGDATRLEMEVLYNQFSLFHIAIIFYACSLCFAFAYLAGLHQSLFKISYGFLLIAIFMQMIAIAMRIYLMERPPVGTLYESILFVGLIAPVVSLFVERRLQNGLGILSGAICGVMLGLLASSMIGEGDDMKMLGAVLNTRFWLATHVLCITIGYGWCLLTSVLAHIILFGTATRRIAEPARMEMVKALTTHALFSLLFTTVGTILGGIWADQSWGRFWGWDPKENGALLIVLWLIWLIHGKIAGQISRTIWLAGMGYLSVIVAVAWIGVNLLGVGLHSYGFIDGVFWGLGLFAMAEFIIIGFLVYKINLSEEKKIAD